MSEKKHYDGIDWLRTIACIGIIMMHMVAKDNNSYELSGFVFRQIIPSFTNFVFLFMTISAFGMCCGYYESVLSGRINWTAFYKKRYVKVLPFFAVLVVLDLVMAFSRESVFEAIADLSLLYGLFPNSISVIGVGWFLGVVFAFYLIFPFFCVLIENKRRAWLVFVGSIILNYICGSYFELGRTNIIYCLCFFIAGGLVYLYRIEIVKLKNYISLPITVISIVLYYAIGEKVYMCLLVSITLLIVAISVRGRGKNGANKVMSFISEISMEIYLSHMVIFRIIEKLHLNTILGNGLLQYIVTVIIVIIGSIFFSLVVKKIIDVIFTKLGWK